MTDLKDSKLFSPVKIGGLELKNRIIRAGCFEGMCQDESPTDDLLEHHRAIAAGGVAMTTVAYCGVSRNGLAYGHEMWMRDDIMPMLTKIAGAIHNEGAKASIQLGHCGYFANPHIIKQRPIGPSAKFCILRTSFSREMTTDDMRQVRDDFVSAAKKAIECGFDAVELHSGHGYLLSQFLSPYTNKRTDEYGGSLENRLRYPVSVVKAVREAVGPDYPILIKMNLRDGFNGGLELDDAVEVAKAYEAVGASALILSCGFTSKTPFYLLRGGFPLKGLARSQETLFMKIGALLFARLLIKKYPFTEMFLLDFAKKVRKAVKLPLVLIGGVCSKKGFETAMEEGFDFVQIGRATVRDPNFVNKLKDGKITESDCDHCNRCIGEMAERGVYCVCLSEGRELPG